MPRRRRRRRKTRNLTAKDVVQTIDAEIVQLMTNCVLTTTKRATLLKCAVLRINMGLYRKIE